MAKQTKKQHYIPRCYLKWFSSDGKSIYAYDKKLSKAYDAPMMSVCFENNLYTISDEFVARNNAEAGTSAINRLTIERDFFSKDVEPNLDLMLRQIDEIRENWLTGKEQYYLNPKEKLEVALHLVTLFFRHPLLINSAVDDYMRMERASLDMIKEIMAVQTGEDGFRKLQVKLEWEKPVLGANLTFMSNELLMQFAEAIAKNIFVFWMSPEPVFYTSDYPIVVYAHVKDVRPMYMGLAQYGSEVMFALSPKLALSVYDRECFKSDEDLDGCFILAQDKEIRHHNIPQYVYAQRHVFSLGRDFSMIETLYAQFGNKHPFVNPIPKSDIVSGLGHY